MFTKSQLRKRERAKILRKVRNIIHNNVPNQWKHIYLPVSAAAARRTLGALMNQMNLLSRIKWTKIRA